MAADDTAANLAETLLKIATALEAIDKRLGDIEHRLWVVEDARRFTLGDTLYEPNAIRITGGRPLAR